MDGPLYHLAVTLGGVLGTMGLWLAVQQLWGRLFQVEGDVLAARAGCGGCAHAHDCAAAELCDGPSTRNRSTPNDKAG